MKASTSATYTTKRLSIFDFNEEIDTFIHKGISRLVEITGGDFPNVHKLDLLNIITNQIMLMTFKDSKPVGFLWATLKTSVFSNDVLVLMQQSLYAEPGTRAANYLLKHFLDFGKDHADHVITMITPYTNIKPSSLEKLGFSKLETLYRWKNGRRRW